jgi:hypothetical protein
MLLVLGVGVGLVIVVLTTLAGRQRRRVFSCFAAGAGLVLGLPGLVLTMMATVTDHHVTFWNENLLVLHPGALLLPPAGLLLAVTSTTSAWSRHAARVVVGGVGVMAAGAVVAVVGKVLPGLDQHNGSVLAVVAPVWLSLWLCRRAATA